MEHTLKVGRYRYQIEFQEVGDGFVIIKITAADDLVLYYQREAVRFRCEEEISEIEAVQLTTVTYGLKNLQLELFEELNREIKLSRGTLAVS